MEYDDQDRIDWLSRKRWVGYTRAKEALNKLGTMLSLPPTHRAPNLLLLGDTNNGKTSIALKFLENNPIKEADDGRAIVPVLYIQMPPKPDESRFYERILEELNTPFRIRAPVSEKLNQVIKVMKAVNTRMLMIDEIHHILSGTIRKQHEFLNVLKYLGNELKMPLVGIGTREALRAIHSDDQLANRFEGFPLPLWKTNNEYRRFLATCETILPLKYKSSLKERDIATYINYLSEGLIGETTTLLQRAAQLAINNGSEKITKELLDELHWIRPSERRRFNEELLM